MYIIFILICLIFYKIKLIDINYNFFNFLYGIVYVV